MYNKLRFLFSLKHISPCTFRLSKAALLGCSLGFYICVVILLLLCFEPGAVARSDARPLCMQTVAGSILMSGNILSWRLVKK